MKWCKLDAYHSESDAGYHVSRATLNGEERYTAWSPEKRLIGTCDTPEAAARLCEENEITMDYQP